MTNGYKSRKEREERKKIITIFAVIYGVVLLTIIILLVSVLSYDRVYSGVYLNNISVSGMTREEVAGMINSAYEEAAGDSAVTFVYKGEIIGSIKYRDLAIEYDTEAIVDAVYNPGHEGSMFGRLSEILRLSGNKLYVDIFDNSGGQPLAKYDETILKTHINDIVSTVASDIKQHNITQEDGVLKIISGCSGIVVDRDALREKILEAAIGFKSATVDLEEISTVKEPDEFNVQTVYSTYNIAPVNASYAKKSDGSVVIVSEENGQSVEISDLVKVSQQIEAGSENTLYTVPVKTVYASVKAEDLTEPTFTDVIGEKSTSYAGGSAARKHNIQLGASTVNGYILLPGETFSFNDYVGDTTVEKGYAMGIGYENGDSVPTPGGGICQVSSTLYNALINAGIEIVQRYCHSMPVGYLPRGLDAAVAYGIKDLKFRNNLDVPIKIVAKTNSSSVTFQICGVNKHKDTKYTFSASKVDEYRDEEGKLYYVYQTYRTVTVNGKVTEDKKPFNRSTYYIK